MKWSHLVLLPLLVMTLSQVSPTTAQEVTPDPAVISLLNQTYLSADGRVSMKYPSDWLQQSYESDVAEILLHLSNDAETLASLGDRSKPFRSGNFYMSVEVFERSVMHYPDVDFDNTLDVLSIRKALPTVEPGWEYEKLDAVTINNRPAVQTFNTLADYADEYDLLIDLGDGLLARVIAFTPLGELEQWNPLVQAVASSITYKPYTKADLTETYASKDGKVSVKYPKGWEASKTFEGNMWLLDVTLRSEYGNFGLTVAKHEDDRSTFENLTDVLAKSLQNLPHTTKSSFGSLNLTINSHPAQMMAIPYSDLPRIRVMLAMDLGDRVFAFVDGGVDKTQFERWQRIALVIAETITYSP